MPWKISQILSLILVLSVFSDPAKAQTENTLTHKEVLNFVSQAKEISICKVRAGEQVLTLGPKLECTPKAVRELSSILADPGSYEEGGHRCNFSPNYLLIISGENGRMNVLLCYGCRDYQASMSLLKSPQRSFAPSAQALKAILDRLGLKDP